jgi:hypothetical protein
VSAQIYATLQQSQYDPSVQESAIALIHINNICCGLRKDLILHNVTLRGLRNTAIHDD